jgi:hypothetical protein
MSIEFKLKDVTHRVIVKFVPAWLPGAKKKYYAKAVLQPELDIDGVASKASVYNITTSPKVIIEGFNAAIRLLMYLTADNYTFNCGLFRLSIRIPGEYDGSETHLPEGIHPEVRLTVDDEMRKYIRDNVQVTFDGIEETNGYIGEVTDEASGISDSVVTPDNIVAIRGYGLKVEGDAAHAGQTGVFLVNSAGQETPVKAIAVNEPRLLKVLTPATLSYGDAYSLLVRTQSTVRGSGHYLKELREVLSPFTLTVRQPTGS